MCKGCPYGAYTTKNAKRSSKHAAGWGLGSIGLKMPDPLGRLTPYSCGGCTSLMAALYMPGNA